MDNVPNNGLSWRMGRSRGMNEGLEKRDSFMSWVMNLLDRCASSQRTEWMVGCGSVVTTSGRKPTEPSKRRHGRSVVMTSRKWRSAK